MFSFFIKVLMSILSLCLYTMRLNLQFRWFAHTEQCLWENNQMLHILNWKTQQFESRRSGVHSLEDCQNWWYIAVNKLTAYSGKIKISPNLNDIARNHLAAHKWPLSAIKMLFALQGFHWLYIKSPQFLESESNKTIAGLAKIIILDGLEWFWDEPGGGTQEVTEEYPSKFSETKQACLQIICWTDFKSRVDNVKTLSYPCWTFGEGGGGRGNFTHLNL